MRIVIVGLVAAVLAGCDFGSTPSVAGSDANTPSTGTPSAASTPDPHSQ